MKMMAEFDWAGIWERGILCINKKWEDMAMDELIEINNSKYDFVICSHALYYITDLHNSFKKCIDLLEGDKE